MGVGEVLKSKATKIGGSVLGGAGLVTLAINLMNEKITMVSEEIDSNRMSIMKIVDTKHDQVMSELKHLTSAQKELRELVLRVDERLYHLNRKVNAELKPSLDTLYSDNTVKPMKHKPN